MSAPRRPLRQRLRVRIARWARERQGLDLPPFSLQARRIYILPTRAGLGFAVLIVAMLATALNYSNSMVMLIACLLAGFALLSIHECHRQLKGLLIVHAHAEDSFVGSAGRLELRFENSLEQVRGPLQLRCDAEAETTGLLAPRAVSPQYLEYRGHRRGRYAPGRIAIWTTAPHGLFRAWSWLHLSLHSYVYPKPAGALPLPARGGARASLMQSALTSGSEEWASLRPYVAGDSPRAVAWKQYARGAPLLVAQYEGAAAENHELNFESLAALPTEARLSQLCQWVLHCEATHEAYSLRLPGRHLAAGQGPAQRRAALRALASYGQTAEDPPT